MYGVLTGARLAALSIVLGAAAAHTPAARGPARTCIRLFEADGTA